MVTLSGRNFGGLSLILIMAAGLVAPKAGASIGKPIETVSATRIVEKQIKARFDAWIRDSARMRWI
jgi:hypothetical protein